MAPVAIPQLLNNVVRRARQLASTAAELHTRSDALSPLEVQARGAQTLHTRDDAPADTYNPGQGTSSPTSLNNQAFLALFAILGFAMVVAAMWFFFWAKNGGFEWREGDWEDYKSTVLRRKGPDGRTLSNATKSTKLGGGSSIAGTQHYKWQKQAARSVVGRDEKGRKGILAKRGFAGTHSILYSDDYMTESFGTKSVTDEMTEINTFNNGVNGHHTKRYKDRDVQQYKKEKAARVGGLNRAADGSHFGTEADRSDTYTEPSEEPLVRKSEHDRERKDAERRAKEEATRMERRWKKEAEAAAAALAHENDASPPPPPAHRKSAAPNATPTGNKNRRSSTSPKKRDYSYTTGPESEVLSTAYTGSSRTASYYENYRPRHDGDGERRSRQSSPKKSKPREGGYRRGVADSDFD